MEGSSSNDSPAAGDPTFAASVDTTPTAAVDSTPPKVNTSPTAADSEPWTPTTPSSAASASPSTAAGTSTSSATGTSPASAVGASPASAAGDNAHGADPVLLSQLMEMGVATNLAIRALLLSGNSSVEAAFTWLSELSAEEADVLAIRPVEDDALEWEDLEEESDEDLGHKMVLVVDTTLRMKPGKMAAQVGHAVLGLYRVLKRNPIKHRNNLVKWETYGEKMVVVRGSGVEQLRDLRKQADLHRLPAYTVADAGLTQIEPGSQTVLAIFGPVAEVDIITRDLRLL